MIKLADIKILLVEDDAIEAMDLKLTLESFNYSVPYVASSGEEVVEKAAIIQPDLILMDIYLKGDMDGIEAASHIKDLNIPVIYLTAHSEKSTVDRAKLTSPYGYLIKPFQASELHHTIDLALFKFQQQQKLKESEEKYRFLTEHMQDIVWTMDLNLNFTYISPSVEKVLGFTPEEAMQSIEEKLWIPRTRSKVQNLLEQQLLLEDGQADPERILRKDLEYKHKDGSIKWLENLISGIRDEKSQLIGIHGVSRDITEYKKFQTDLIRYQMELEVRNKIADVFLTVPDEEMYTKVLKIILEAVDSPYGVFGFLDSQGDLIIPTMTRTVWSECEIPDKSVKFLRKDLGYSSLSRSINEKKSFLINKTSNLTPKGHIKIKRHIAIPLIHREKVVGLIMVANKKSDYSQDDLQLMQALANDIAPILDARLKAERENIARKESEDEIKYRIKLERLLMDISRNFINLPLEKIDEGINQALERIGKFVGVDRSYLFLINSKDYFTNTHEWTAPGISSQIDNLQQLKIADHKYILQELTTKGQVQISSLKDFSESILREKELLKAQSIQSLIAVALNKDGNLKGFVGFDSVKKEVRWSQIYLNLLLILAEIFNNLLDKKEFEETLKESLSEKEVLLSEIHHRVKNNMQIISSLFHLQSRYVGEPESRKFLRDTQSRVRAMAMIHEKIYLSHNLSSINFKDYVSNLVHEILANYSLDNRLKLTLNIEEVEFNPETMMPLALILNELVTNTLKYAFPENQEGELKIALVAANGEYILSVSDDGVGLPDKISIENTETLGLRLVYSLVQQLDGTIKLNQNQGTEFIINFQEANYPSRWNRS